MHHTVLNKLKCVNWNIFKAFFKVSAEHSHDFFPPFFSPQTELQRCVMFQLDFGIDIGLHLQWSKQIGCWLIQCKRTRADQEDWGWSMHRCLHGPNNVCRDTFKQRPSFSNAGVEEGGATRLGHSDCVLEMTFWQSRRQGTPQGNGFVDKYGEIYTTASNNTHLMKVDAITLKCFSQ